MNNRAFVLLFFAVITVFTACKDKDLPPPTPITTYLNVVNATADTIKYYINGTRQNNISDLFVGGSTGYLSVLSGTQNYKFSRSTGNFATLFTTTFSLDTGLAYSIFVTGNPASQAFRVIDDVNSAADIIQADTVTATNTVVSPAAIRFVNASPDAGSLNVTVGGGDSVNFNNCAFKYVSPFVLLYANTKEVKVFLTGSTTALVDTTIAFTENNIYTLFTKGQLNGKGSSKFGVSLVIYPE